MSDERRNFLLQFGRVFVWFLAIVQYLGIVGIMYLLSLVIPTDANVWLVGLIVSMLVHINAMSKLIAREATKQVKEEEK
ncbi:hypothetical protein [Staphylococcus phage PT1-4]